MTDLLTELEEAQDDDRRRSGDFTWVRQWVTTGAGGRVSCIFCRHEGRWDHIKSRCSGTWLPRPAGPCMNQHLLTNQLRAYATKARNSPTPTARADLAYRVAVAQAAQIDVDPILTAIAQEA